ncbi:MAG: GAP family protein [Candidatus Uhrbacteria bacterium]|nr:hypothetical protein [Patescibacteria group bacterium]MBU1907017.1 hypothetical protein [Patescibacteria group bacterium]
MGARKKIAGVLLAITLFLLPSILSYHVSAADNADQADVPIFYSAFCGMCSTYLDGTLEPKLHAAGYSTERFDYVSDPEARSELNDRLEAIDWPRDHTAHMMIFLPNGVILGGHVPEHLIDAILADDELTGPLALIQDEMHGSTTSFQVWAGDETVTEFDIETTLEEALSGSGIETTPVWFPWLVISTAFADGLNPCAIAVLLLFVAFLLAVSGARKRLWQMGLAYILAVFVAYLLIGFGILGVTGHFFPEHAVGRVVAWIVISVGLLELLSIAFPKIPIKFSIPSVSKGLISKLIERGTIPAALVLGFLVGLCTFPCSGGPYLAILGMISDLGTRMEGLGYLLLYNAVFVAPLAILLLLASRPKLHERLRTSERKFGKKWKIVIALITIGLGILSLLLF